MQMELNSSRIQRETRAPLGIQQAWLLKSLDVKPIQSHLIILNFDVGA